MKKKHLRTLKAHSDTLGDFASMLQRDNESITELEAGVGTLCNDISELKAQAKQDVTSLINDLWDRYDKMYDCIRALEKQNLLLSKALANLDERVARHIRISE